DLDVVTPAAVHPTPERHSQMRVVHDLHLVPRDRARMAEVGPRELITLIRVPVVRGTAGENGDEEHESGQSPPALPWSVHLCLLSTEVGMSEARAGRFCTANRGG